MRSHRVGCLPLAEVNAGIDFDNKH